MAVLTYDFAVVNQNLLPQVLASYERRIAQFNQRTARTLGVSATGTGGTVTSISSARLRSVPAQQADAHVKAYKSVASAAAALDKQRAAALVQIHKAEERQRLASERAVQ
ncbi:MAG TPA: hypothetical protein VFW03_26595, partial [Gemmatimonadaceae bacterium]|nr:hypothetical protein [Gemmatimonadaceae bacterium]